ncbi:MAG: BrnT family toxin [Candidatus Sabulitectum sp.]|nr:BrnT family toxin [Candidatus Sabulitectum sp.]
MKFEYDRRKSHANKRKHGIDFEEAQLLWEDPNRLEVPARTEDEKRFVLTGRIAEISWSAVFTIRVDRIRIISVRHARRKEVRAYEG